MAEGGGGHGAGGSHLSLTASLGTGQSGPGSDDLPKTCGHIEGITDGFFIGLACTGKGKQHRREHTAAARCGGSNDPFHAGVALGGLEGFGGHLCKVIPAIASARLMGLFHLGGIAAGQAAAAALGRVILPAGGLHHMPQVMHGMAACLFGQAALGQITAQDGLGKGEVLAAGSGQHFFTG